MDKLLHTIELRGLRGEEARRALRREWLVTNGLGGYASGTISGSVGWRYHGMLIAAFPAPLGRMVMLNHLAESIRQPGEQWLQFSGEEPEGPGDLLTAGYVTQFRLENQLPLWRYEINGVTIEKQVLCIYGQNTVHVQYRIISALGPLQLKIQPSIHFRHHETPVNEPLANPPYQVRISGAQYEIRAGKSAPVLRMALDGLPMRFTHHGDLYRELFYFHEAERGNPAQGHLWSPGYFTVQMSPGQEMTLLASTEPWNVLLALSPQEALAFYHQRRRRLLALARPAARESPAANLVLAADQFIITPVGRLADAARAHAAGDELRTVIAGYHWFTDWGRDTMISLEGLTLCTGRQAEAGWILRTFAHHARHGLIPNMFPDKEQGGIYNTADATLWFFHALDRYLACTGDRTTLQVLLPSLLEMARFHLQGTDYGIGVDPADRLLHAGAPDLQLTWMDAKVGDWVVTPRRGKPVEINALWYNALRLLAGWVRGEQGEAAARPWGEEAEQVRASFNRRFVCAKTGYLYDVLDGEAGDDLSCRPNQLLAFSLPNPVLEQKYWRPVLEVVRERLLTPVGLRSLSSDSPDFKPRYFGDLRARDAAYHQGTVWAWLIGPFIDAWLKVYPQDKAGARSLLKGFIPHLDEACVGSISEIFDAEQPFKPRGCVAQAWSVAEVLRCWIKTAP